MLVEYMWEVFKNTGNVKDYLVYTELKQNNLSKENNKQKLPKDVVNI